MSATRTEKSEVVGGLTEQLHRSPAIYVTDFTGLPVKRMTDLRRKLRGAGVAYVVVKNTLAARAFAAVNISGMDDVLVGATGLVFAGSDPVGAAKVLTEFQKEYQQPTVKAGLLEGRRISADEVKRLASLPPREMLLAQLGASFQAPMAGFVGALSGLLYQWVGALEALRVQRGNAA